MRAFTHIGRGLVMAAVLGFLVPLSAQTAPSKAANEVHVRSSPAYAELLLKRTEVQAQLEMLAVEYTDQHPKVAEGRYALEMIDRERARLFAVKPADAGKLSLGLGRLMVRKAELEVDLWTLRKSMQEAHPDVKRAKRRVEIYETAIREILG